MNPFLWNTAPTNKTLLVDGSGLAINTVGVAGSAYNNSSMLDKFGYFELATGNFVSAPVGQLFIYRSISVDGINFDTNKEIVYSFNLNTITGNHRYISNLFLLDPCKMKFGLINRANFALPSGTSLNIYITDDSN